MTEEDQERIKAASRAMLVAKPKRKTSTSRKLRPKYPFASYGLGGTAEDRDELSAVLKSKGVPTEVNSEGDPIIVSDRHAGQVSSALGWHQKNSFGFKR